MATAMFSGSAAATDISDVNVNGFIDVIYTVTNDGQAASSPASGTNAAENKFLADGEIDFSGTIDKATVRLDVDVRINAVGGGNNAEIEQAYFAVPVGSVTLIGGVFNNPIGYEAEDAPDLDFTSHNIIYDILNHQTALEGNNLAGAAVAGKLGPVTLTGAFVNDLGHAPEENSFALIANVSPVKGLALEIGYVAQDDDLTINPLTAGDVIDINAVWSNDMFTVGIDYMSFDQLLDPATVIWAGANIGDFNVKVRFESVALDASGAEDAEQTTLYGSYPLSKNTTVALEIKDGDVADSGLAAAGVLPGSVEGSLVTLEFIGTF